MATNAGIPAPGEVLGLQQQIVRLQALLEAARQVHSTAEENEVLEQVLSIVVRELEMAGASFPAAGLCYGDDPATPGCAPLRWPLTDRDGQPMVELQVAAPEGRALTLYESDFIDGLVLQASVALENARAHQRRLEYVRVQQDLDAARGIQRSLLPQHLPMSAGYQLAFRADACYEVGGDYLDALTLADGSWLFAVADVAGKGLASALMASSFRSAFRAMAQSGAPLAELAARMNQHHWAEGEEARRRYVTAIFARLDPVSGRLQVVNAGHNPGMMLAPGAAPRLFRASGTPLGLLPGLPYAAAELDLPAGARLLLYTDGLTEIFSNGEEFGSGRLLAALSRCSAREADAILKALWAEIAAFAAGGAQQDDMTALVLCRDSAPGHASQETFA